jgi:predicted PurR-regulated permease PerM
VPEKASANNLHRQILFWLGALVAVILVLWLLRDVLLPFVAGLVLAYLLNPLANRLERAGINRTIATLIIVGAFVLVFIVLIMVLVPVLGNQLFGFIQRLPEYVTRLQAMLTQQKWEWLQRLMIQVPDLQNLQKPIGDLMTQAARWLVAFLQSLWSGGRAIISVFALVIVTPVVAFYLLNDWNRIVAKVDSWIPPAHRPVVRELVRDIDRAIGGFFRGQASVCLILGSYYAAALSTVGLNFGLLIGFFAGVLTFIPYVGSLTGLVLALGVALVQFWPDWSPVLLVLGLFVVGQFVEGYILTPKLVGDRVGLHPLWLMFALFAFGYLFGFVGLLMAVPLAAAAGVLARFALKQYLSSSFYRETPRRGG